VDSLPFVCLYLCVCCVLDREGSGGRSMATLHYLNKRWVIGGFEGLGQERRSAGEVYFSTRYRPQSPD